MAPQLIEAIEWRLTRVEAALDEVEPATSASGRSPIDPVIDACDQARRRAARVELNAEVISILVDGGDLNEARAILTGRLAEQVRLAGYQAAVAEAAATQMGEALSRASAAIEQAQSLLSLAAEPAWHSSRGWLCGAVSRAAELRCRIAHAVKEAEAAKETAFTASAHAVMATVAQGLAQSSVERAGSDDQITRIEAYLSDDADEAPSDEN
ncbi:MAG: hypothetical protein LBD77_02925 [Bifidobacteriaceae bacterium]|jgi:hypothetical protein|nr:hypothetical protein [Bifidobacteriaceae bacterium]